MGTGREACPYEAGLFRLSRKWRKRTECLVVKNFGTPFRKCLPISGHLPGFVGDRAVRTNTEGAKSAERCCGLDWQAQRRSNSSDPYGPRRVRGPQPPGKPRPANVAGLSGVAVGLKLGEELWELEEVVRNKVVAAPARRRWFRLRLTGTSFIQVSINSRWLDGREAE